MKKLFCLLFIVFSVSVVSAETVPVSYVIISSTNSTSTEIILQELVKSTKYECDTQTLSCSKKESTTTPYLLSEAREVSLNEASNLYLPEKSNAESYRERPIPVPHDSLPKNARFITPNPQNNITAFYTTTGLYGIKNTRTYWAMSTSTRKTPFFTEQIPTGLDLISEASRVFSWNASGTTLVYLSDRNGYQQIYKAEAPQHSKSLKGVPLLTKKYTVLDFLVINNDVYFIANREDVFTYNLYKLSLVNGSSVVKLVNDVMYTDNLTSSKDSLLFTKNDHGIGILYSYNTKNKTLKPFTGINYSTVESSTSTNISKPFYGRYYKGNNKGKAIIWLHGGPYRQTAEFRHSWGSYAMYDWILEKANDSGTTILKLDYPGSFGYGKKYADSLVEKIGINDIESIKNAIAFLKKEGHSEIYLFGTSYGGYLSLKGAVDLPNKITGALAIAPVTDWDVLLERIRPSPFEVHFKNKKIIKNQYKKANITNKLTTDTPNIIIMHGEIDSSVTFSQSLYFMSEANRLGLSNDKIKLYSFKNEDHVLKNPFNIQEVCEKLKLLTKSENMSCKLN